MLKQQTRTLDDMCSPLNKVHCLLLFYSKAANKAVNGTTSEHETAKRPKTLTILSFSLLKTSSHFCFSALSEVLCARDKAVNPICNSAHASHDHNRSKDLMDHCLLLHRKLLSVRANAMISICTNMHILYSDINSQCCLFHFHATPRISASYQNSHALLLKKS